MPTMFSMSGGVEEKMKESKDLKLRVSWGFTLKTSSSDTEKMKNFIKSFEEAMKIFNQRNKKTKS